MHFYENSETFVMANIYACKLFKIKTIHVHFLSSISYDIFSSIRGAAAKICPYLIRFPSHWTKSSDLLPEFRLLSLLSSKTFICISHYHQKTAAGFTLSLKQKCRHFDEIFITGCTESCQNDNFRCSQWLKFHQNDNISVSVFVTFTCWSRTYNMPEKTPMIPARFLKSFLQINYCLTVVN